MPDFQEYHALRGLRDAKLLCHRLSHDPHDPITSVDDERDRIPHATGDFPVHEEVLQLPDARCAERPEPVARAPVPNGERQADGVYGDPDFAAPGLPSHMTSGGTGKVLRPDDEAQGLESDLSRDRQRKRKT